MSTNKDKFLAGIASDSKHEAARRARDQEAVARYQAMSKQWDDRVLPVVGQVVQEYAAAYSQARLPDRLKLVPTPEQDRYIGVARRAEIVHERGYGPNDVYVFLLTGKGTIELGRSAQQVSASTSLAEFDKAWMEEALAQALDSSRPIRF
jgi:hypothetical protein